MFSLVIADEIAGTCGFSLLIRKRDSCGGKIYNVVLAYEIYSLVPRPSIFWGCVYVAAVTPE